KGDEANPQLTRIYGYAFKTKEELEAYVKLLEEAQKRDHKKLGPELDLFVFSDLVGGGLPLWTPKGTIVRNILDEFVWKLRKARGYEQVDIPHITKKDLYEKSGHWEKFQNELFKINTREGRVFAMKPMNCPHHTQIYARKQFSYRELPQRYVSTTKVYRDEQTGELSGLLRVRAITQDDAHVFCRQTQAKEEILKIWDIISEFYGAAGFILSARLSLHDPKNQEAYLGTPEVWQKAEEELRSIVKEKGASAYEAVGEAAFYGPKIDFIAKDSLGREWQLATIQLDMNMPERFDLFCINEKGEKERIVMLHAAIMGSIERYLSILIEHFGGAFPYWLAPVQIKILAISEKAADYAKEVKKELEAKNIRAELDLRNESLGKKIREAELEKIPYIFVVGEKEAEGRRVSVRERGKGNLGQRTLEEFIALAEK
ncbi:MAG: threonine--tRNA ligase, partial [Patescibacteria group bacterium]